MSLVMSVFLVDLIRRSMSSSFVCQHTDLFGLSQTWFSAAPLGVTHPLEPLVAKRRSVGLVR